MIAGDPWGRYSVLPPVLFLAPPHPSFEFSKQKQNYHWKVMHIVTQVIKEPDERIVLRNQSPSPLDPSKFGKLSPSYRNQGDADFYLETSYTTSRHSRSPSPHSRSPSPHLDQRLPRERSAASAHLCLESAWCSGGITGHFNILLPQGYSPGDTLIWWIITPLKIFPKVKVPPFLFPPENVSQDVCWEWDRWPIWHRYYLFIHFRCYIFYNSSIWFHQYISSVHYRNFGNYRKQKGVKKNHI